MRHTATPPSVPALATSGFYHHRRNLRNRTGGVSVHCPPIHAESEQQIAEWTREPAVLVRRVGKLVDSRTVAGAKMFRPIRLGVYESSQAVRVYISGRLIGRDGWRYLRQRLWQLISPYRGDPRPVVLFYLLAWPGYAAVRLHTITPRLIGELLPFDEVAKAKRIGRATLSGNALSVETEVR